MILLNFILDHIPELVMGLFFLYAYGRVCYILGARKWFALGCRNERDWTRKRTLIGAYQRKAGAWWN